MVANYGPEEQMVMRLHVPASSLVNTTAVQPSPLYASIDPTPITSFNIEITAPGGALLLRLFEHNGMLAAEGDESRWEEAAKRFVDQMLQWSGQVGIRWKDEAQKAAKS